MKKMIKEMDGECDKSKRDARKVFFGVWKGYNFALKEQLHFNF